MDALARPGNEYTGKDADHFIENTFNRIKSLNLKHTDVIIRGDSGFASPAFYEAVDRESFYFIVRLKANATLNRIAEETVTGIQVNPEQNQTIYYETEYQAKSWPQPYRVLVQSEYHKGEMALWTHTFLVTNMLETNPQTILAIYKKRGDAENKIKEQKSGFGFDKTDSSTFVRNSARALVSGVAYNLIQLFRALTMADDKHVTIDTLRFQLFHTAGRVTKHARQTIIHLASNHVHRELFWRLVTSVQRLT